MTPTRDDLFRVRPGNGTTMSDAADTKELTTNIASPDTMEQLYVRAFAEYGSRALWNIRRFDAPTPEQIVAIVRQLRTEGDMGARRLAEQIERAARADL